MGPHIVNEDFTDKDNSGDNKPDPREPMEAALISTILRSPERSADCHYGCRYCEAVAARTEIGTAPRRLPILRFGVARSMGVHLREYQYHRNGGDIVEQIWLEFWLWTRH